MLRGAPSHSRRHCLTPQERERTAPGEVWLLSLPVRASVSRCRGDAPAVAARCRALVLSLELRTVRCWQTRNFSAEGRPVSRGSHIGGGSVRKSTELQVSGYMKLTGGRQDCGCSEQWTTTPSMQRGGAAGLSGSRGGRCFLWARCLSGVVVFSQPGSASRFPGRNALHVPDFPPPASIHKFFTSLCYMISHCFLCIIKTLSSAFYILSLIL